MEEQPQTDMKYAIRDQKAWAKQLICSACGLLDRVRDGYTPTSLERLGARRDIAFAYRRAKEHGFEKELDVLMLNYGLHIKRLHEDIWKDEPSEPSSAQ